MIERTFAQGLAVFIDHATRQRAPGLEGYRLGRCLIAVENHFARQLLRLVQKAQQTLLARLQTADRMSRGVARSGTPVGAGIVQT